MSSETAEIVAADQPTQPAASQNRKRKADASSASPPASPAPKTKKAKKEAASAPATTNPDGSEMPSEQKPAQAGKKVASPAKKRKTTEDDSTAGAPLSKKTKKNDSKPAAKPRQTKRTRKAVEVPPPPQAPSPVEVTAPVQAKINAIKRFKTTETLPENSLLGRDPDDPDIVCLPQLDLLGVVMNMYFHYELGKAETEASYDDVWDAVIDTFKREIGSMQYEADFVTLNLRKSTTLEKRIKEKIAHHGLEDTNLLEIEMELCARANRAQHGIEYAWEAEKAMEAGDFLNEVVEEGWYGNGKTQRKVETGRMRREDEKEAGKMGVCLAKTIEVV